MATTDSYAQTAYTAYRESLEHQTIWSQWEDLPDDVKTAWRGVVLAVMGDIRRSEREDGEKATKVNVKYVGPKLLPSTEAEIIQFGQSILGPEDEWKD